MMKLSLRKSISTKIEAQSKAVLPELVSPVINKHVQSFVVEEEGPSESNYSWPICLFPVIYAAITLYIMLTISSMNAPERNPIEAQGTMKMLQRNLAHAPILDITNMVPISRLHRHIFHCPEGYEIASLGSWKGVDSGCICRDGTVHDRTYCITHFQNSCRSVKYTAGQIFTYWKDQQLCIRYSKRWMWRGDRDCPDQFTKCSEGICVPQEHNCPLTDLLQNPKGHNINSVQIGNKYYDKLHNGSSPLLYFSMTPGNKSNAPCFDQSYGPQFQSRKYYPLAIQPEVGCNTYGNAQNYSITLDQDYQLKVYEDNDFSDFNSIPYFDRYIDRRDTYSLQLIQRIKIKQSQICNTIDPEVLKNMRLEGETIHSYTKYLSSLTVFACIFLLSTSVIFYLFRSIQCLTINFKKFKQIEYQIACGIIIAFCSIALGVIYFTQADGTNGIDGQNDLFQQYQKESCFEDEGLQYAVTKVIKFSLASYNDTEPYVKFAFYFAMVYVFGITILLVLQYRRMSQFCVKPWQE